MSEQQNNINPWAEKLQQVSVPEPGEAKRRLLNLLNREMPPPPNKDRRRWILVLLLLLLLIGVCNCPGLERLTRHSANNPPNPAHRLPVAGNLQKPGYPAKTETYTSTQKTAAASTSPLEAAIPPGAGGRHTAYSSGRSKLLLPGKSITPGNDNKQLLIAGPAAHSPKKTSHTHKKHNDTNPAIITGDKAKGTIAHNNNEQEASNPATENEPAANTLPAAPDSIKRGTPPAPGTTAKLPGDSANKKATKTSDSTSKKTTTTIQKGWSLAIGLNQSFPVGGQQRVNAGPGGNTNIIGDYIPVPQLCYRFKKKWSVQLELAIRAPQYTQPLRLRAVFDTFAAGGLHYNVYLKKLFYLQLPLSIHYNISNNFSAGTGMRYGRLENAIGLFENRFTSSGRPDSILYSKVQSLKKDSSAYLYNVLQPGDWQWFADINYQWKNLSVALRYNHSLGNFINLPVQGASTAKGINSSVQLSVRYTLWRQKQKKKSAVK